MIDDDDLCMTKLVTALASNVNEYKETQNRRRPALNVLLLGIVSNI